MYSTVRCIRRAASRLILQAITLVLFVGLLSGPATARADDIVLRWNEIAARTATATSPFNQARVGAIVQLAVFEAVNAVTGDYEPYLNPATSAPSGTSVEAAVIIAAHRTLTTYFPAPATVALLDAARDADLGAIPAGAAKTAGIAVGMAAANAMIALRATDGSAPLTTIIPAPGQPGDYQLTTGCAAGMFFNWQNVTPFGIASAADYLLSPPSDLTSNRYSKDFLEVKYGGRCHERGSASGSCRGRKALRRIVTELRAEHGDPANRRGKGNLALRERASARLDPDGHQ